MAEAGMSPADGELDRAASVDATCDAILRRIFQAASGESIRAALVGRGIVQSRTPRMHMAEGQRIGLRYAYRLLDFDVLGLEDSAVRPMILAAPRHGVSGLNVTYPFKQAVLGCLDELSANASAIGAVNTVVLRGGRAVGHNTDCWGFTEAFRREMAGASLGLVLLVGAGGAGMAVARAMLELGARHIAIFDIDGQRAASLARGLQDQFGKETAGAVEDVRAVARRADGLINASPVGMANHPGLPVPRDLLRPDLWVADVVYFPAETELLRAATAAGCRTMPGRGMAIFQAVRAFQLITGHPPDPEEMSRHFTAAG
jgi:shikimate dehydrogenase